MTAGQATRSALDARLDFDRRTAPARLRAAPVASLNGAVTFAIHEDLVEVERDWRAFEERADCTVFQTFEWLSTWQRHIGTRRGAMPAIVVGRDAAGQMLFLLPLAVEPYRALRRLTWLGSDLCDYNAPLLEPDFARQVDASDFARLWQDIKQRLRRHSRLAYDFVSFEKMPDKVGAQANPFVQLGVTANPSGAYLTHLTGDWETFYTDKRSSATRRRDRTKRKKLAEFGEVRVVNTDGVDAADALNTLIEQKAQQFAAMGVPNLFARPGYKEFFREIVSDPTTRRLAHVSRLDVGPTRAAVNLGLIFHGCYYHVLASYDGGEVSKFGPGAAHLHDLMRHAIESGCTMFDFTIGDERYKRDWSDTELKLWDHMAAATPSAWLMVVPLRALRGLKRWIKQTPALWNAFSRAREFVGSLRPR